MTEVMLMGAGPRALVEALPSRNREAILADFARRDELAALDARTYYPLSLYNDLCEYVEERLGTYAFLRLGRKIAVAVMEASFPASLATVEEAIAEIDRAHHVHCRPLIGAFELVERSARMLTVRYTAPYNCVLQEGLFYEVALRYGAANASVAHVECRRRGSSACRFEIRY